MGNNKTKDKGGFSEEHPKLNFLLGLITLSILAILLVSFVLWTLGAVGTGLNKLSKVVSNMDQVVIVALITGAISIVGIVISSIVAKIFEYRRARNEYLAKKREEPYSGFVEMVYKLQRNMENEGDYTTEEMIRDIQGFSKQLTLWGSSRVVKKWVKFRKQASNIDDAKEKVYLVEEIMNEMRKNLGTKRVKKGNLLSFFINGLE